MTKRMPSETAIELARRIVSLRLRRLWSRETLAEKSGINVYTLKHFERTGQISLERLISLSRALGVSTEMERLFKPRQRVDVDNNWQAPEQLPRKRGRRVKILEDESYAASPSPVTPDIDDITQVSESEITED